MNIRLDFQKLKRDFDIGSAGVVELDALARQVDPDNEELAKHPKGRITLQSIVNIYCGRSLNKGRVRISNWELDLDEAQQTCEVFRRRFLYFLSVDTFCYVDAANDAHCALSVYNRLCAKAAELEKEVDLASVTDVVFEKNVVAAEKAKETETTTAPLDAEATTAAGTEAKSTETPAAKKLDTPKTPPPSIICPPGVKPQPYRAYLLWHEEELPLETICARLRTPENPLAKSTVMSVSLSTAIVPLIGVTDVV